MSSNVPNNHEELLNDKTNVGKRQELPLTVDTTCGFWCFRNSILQRFANQTSYVVVYGLVGCSLAMTSAYYNGTISTMEKRFKIPSRNTGFILAGNDIAQVLCAWFLGYYAGRKHRPRWMSLGLLTFISFCLLTAMPHFLYGSGLEASELTKEYYANLNATESFNLTLLLTEQEQQEQQQQQKKHYDHYRNLCRSSESQAYCENATIDDVNLIPQIILFIAQFIAGIGASLYYTLGITYMDDNTEKSKAPAMLSLSYFCGLLGPACGYSLASYCLSIYITPNLTPLIDQKDSRWLGAWWLGWLILAALLFLCAFLIFLFPKELPAAATRRAMQFNCQNQLNDIVTEKASVKDMLRTLKRFLHNRLLIYNMLSSLFYCFGYFPYWVFTAKYIEIQYHQTASTSSMVTGTVALIFSAIGILLAGFVLSKYKPNARYLAAWDIIVAFVTATGFIVYAFIGCVANDTILDSKIIADRDYTELIGCSTDCHCDYVRFMPICDINNNQTYISPCHAGCHNVQLIEETGSHIFTNCTCMANNNQLPSSIRNATYIADTFAREGFCPIDCRQSFLTFLAVMCCLKFFAATGRASNLLLSMRAVKPQDKAAFMGLGMMLISLITFIPAPIFFGWLFDRFCLIWGNTCHLKGNCWLYDSKNLRLTLNFVSSAFIFICILLDCGVWYHAKNLQIFDDDIAHDDDDDLNKGHATKELLTIRKPLMKK